MDKEGKFYGVLNILNQDMKPGSAWHLGPVDEMFDSDPTDTMIFNYVISEKTFYLSGQKNDGVGIIACWKNVDKVPGIMTLVNEAYAWGPTETYVQPEYHIVLLLQEYPGAEGSEAALVTTEEEAKHFYDYWSKWYQEQKR